MSEDGLLEKGSRTLEDMLGYVFSDRALLQEALTHPSYSAEHEGARSNQRLEFLGDALLGAVLAHELYARDPDAPEGALTRQRSRLAQGPTLAGIAEEIGLGEWMRFGKGETQRGGRERPSNLADALEAVLGAAFLDGGWDAVRTVILNAFDFDEIEQGGCVFNAKGKLQEWFQAQGLPLPVYELVETSGPEHERRFTVSVTSDGMQLGEATAGRRREAERLAAAEALDKIGEK